MTFVSVFGDSIVASKHGERYASIRRRMGF
jgi:hypothetical protein